MNFKHTVDKEILKLWKGALKTTLKEVTYTREEGGRKNPVTGLYEGGTTLSETIKVLPRDISRDTKKDDTLYITDVKLTLRVPDFTDPFGSPQTSDSITYEGTTYRLMKYDGDVTSTFFHLFLRGL